MLKLITRLVLVGSIAALGLTALAQDPLVTLGETEEHGQVLVGPNGMTLYSFTPDPLNGSVCAGQCAVSWPPLTVESADELSVGEGIPGTLNTFEREDGTLQVAYNGLPLYYWFQDQAPGDTTGHGVNNIWWVVPPATVYAQPIAELGSTLVGPTGMTLYTFTNDTPGESSACYDQCATAWPPLTVESAEDIVAGPNLGELGTIERTDGTLQVTYNGWPLYYWQNDAAVGDATGEGRNDVWFAVAPEVVFVGNSEELGDFLVSPSGMTLYMFDNDTDGVSNCSGDCASAWPPYIVFEDTRLAASEGVEGELGTTTRDNGMLQLTYNGMPLYFWQNDSLPSDTTGQGVGEVWWVVAP